MNKTNETIDTIKARHSVRAFLDKAVDKQTIELILETARWAPSGVNTQPWCVEVAQGDCKQQITDAIIEARETGLEENPDYTYYPTTWFEPYKSRRKQTGMELYGALGISMDEKDRRKEAWYNNYRFFNAPVGLFFFIHKEMGLGSILDLGMFIQNVMLAAQSLGLSSCPQASLVEYPDIVREHLKVDDHWMLVAGMSLGYADPDAAVNRYRVGRLDLDEFVQWHE